MNGPCTCMCNPGNWNGNKMRHKNLVLLYKDGREILATLKCQTVLGCKTFLGSRFWQKLNFSGHQYSDLLKKYILHHIFFRTDWMPSQFCALHDPFKVIYESLVAMLQTQPLFSNLTCFSGMTKEKSQSRIFQCLFFKNLATLLKKLSQIQKKMYAYNFRYTAYAPQTHGSHLPYKNRPLFKLAIVWIHKYVYYRNTVASNVTQSGFLKHDGFQIISGIILKRKILYNLFFGLFLRLNSPSI